MARRNFIENILSHYGGDVEQAKAALRADCEKNPIDARLNLQVLCNATGDEDAAFAASQELMAFAPRDPRVLFNRGWHCFKRDRFREGFALLEHGRLLQTYGNPPLGSIRPIWSRESSRIGGTLLFALEGGLGDEIIQIRFAKNFAEDHGLKVIVAAHPSLAPMINRLPDVSAVAQKEAALGIYHDWWLPGMSAAHVLGLDSSGISGAPYFMSVEKKWKSLVATSAQGRTKIGVRWAGNPEFEHQQLRVFPPELLTSLALEPDVQLYSFQRDNDLVALPPNIIDLAAHLRAWDDTAAFIEEMDVMITSCTSVAHMSAALGKETWVIVPALPYFTWALPGAKSPWYDSVRLFRQKQYGSWENVRAEIHAAVRERLVRAA